MQYKNKRGTKHFPCVPLEQRDREEMAADFQGYTAWRSISVSLHAPSKALAGVRKPALNTHLPSVFWGKDITAY